jgi:hypothetical protein
MVWSFFTPQGFLFSVTSRPLLKFTPLSNNHRNSRLNSIANPRTESAMHIFAIDNSAELLVVLLCKLFVVDRWQVIAYPRLAGYPAWWQPPSPYYTLLRHPASYPALLLSKLLSKCVLQARELARERFGKAFSTAFSLRFLLDRTSIAPFFTHPQSYPQDSPRDSPSLRGDQQLDQRRPLRD